MAPAANWDNKQTSAWQSEEPAGEVSHLWDMHNSTTLRQKTIPPLVVSWSQYLMYCMKLIGKLMWNMTLDNLCTWSASHLWDHCFPVVYFLCINMNCRSLFFVDIFAGVMHLIGKHEVDEISYAFLFCMMSFSHLTHTTKYFVLLYHMNWAGNASFTCTFCLMLVVCQFFLYITKDTLRLTIIFSFLVLFWSDANACKGSDFSCN